MKQYGLRLIALLCLMLAYMAGSALAQEELPQGAEALIEQAYPTYEIAMVSGSGDEQQGVFAVVLSYMQDEREWQILCTVEKSQGDSEYALTTENGSTLPIESKILDVEVKGNLLMITCDNRTSTEASNCYTYSKESGSPWTLIKGDSQRENTRYVGGEESHVVDSSSLMIHDDHLQYRYPL